MLTICLAIACTSKQITANANIDSNGAGKIQDNIAAESVVSSKLKRGVLSAPSSGLSNQLVPISIGKL